VSLVQSVLDNVSTVEMKYPDPLSIELSLARPFNSS